MFKVSPETWKWALAPIQKNNIKETITRLEMIVREEWFIERDREKARKIAKILRTPKYESKPIYLYACDSSLAEVTRYVAGVFPIDVAEKIRKIYEKHGFNEAVKILEKTKSLPFIVDVIKTHSGFPCSERKVIVRTYSKSIAIVLERGYRSCGVGCDKLIRKLEFYEVV
jgi:TPP-dependent 2-oxoacid decarboxylase